MVRTQLYLEDDLWTALRLLANNQHTTVSHLVREAIRDRYVGKLDERRKAMQAFVGIAKDSHGQTDTEQIVRELRRDSRLERLTEE